jgi:uncharacterized iron-regulated protein
MKHLLFLMSVLVAGCSNPMTAEQTNHPLIGKLWQSENQEFISTDNLVEQLVGINYLLIGERHDNPYHHQLEIEILKHAQRQNPKTATVFEMIDQQLYAGIEHAVLKPGNSLSALKEILNWSDINGWPWKDYGPVIYTAVEGGSEIVPGNIDRSTLMQLAKSKEGDSFTQFKEPFKTLAAFPEHLKRHVLEDVFEGHCRLIPKEQLSPMVSIQTMRDAYMASNLYQHKQDKSTILIAGNGHIREDSGVGWHLRQRDPQSSIMSIALIEVDENLHSPQDYLSGIRAEQATYDYIWFTPKFSHNDECAELEAMMKNKPSASKK